jgi:hypothetical protein
MTARCRLVAVIQGTLTVFCWLLFGVRNTVVTFSLHKSYENLAFGSANHLKGYC